MEGAPCLDSPEEKTRLRRSIALVGLMGCGKSTVGARLAKRLGTAFCDADDKIVEAAGMTIPEIFERLGEEAFRDGERKVIARLMTEEPMVIATGGGAFMAHETREAIAARGVAVWLDADLETLVRRTSRRTSRPLLNAGDPGTILADLMATRYPVYAGAPVRVVSSDEVTADEVADQIVAALRSYDARAPEPERLLEGVQ